MANDTAYVPAEVKIMRMHSRLAEYLVGEPDGAWHLSQVRIWEERSQELVDSWSLYGRIEVAILDIIERYSYRCPIFAVNVALDDLRNMKRALHETLLDDGHDEPLPTFDPDTVTF